MGSASTSPLTYPNGPDSGLPFDQALLTDTTSTWRGRMPGWYNPLCAIPLNNYDHVTGITGLSGVDMLMCTINSNGTVGQVGIDQFGPWT
jgi:hypothetical protein